MPSLPEPQAAVLTPAPAPSPWAPSHKPAAPLAHPEQPPSNDGDPGAGSRGRTDLEPPARPCSFGCISTEAAWHVPAPPQQAAGPLPAPRPSAPAADPQGGGLVPCPADPVTRFTSCSSPVCLDNVGVFRGPKYQSWVRQAPCPPHGRTLPSHSRALTCCPPACRSPSLPDRDLWGHLDKRLCPLPGRPSHVALLGPPDGADITQSCDRRAPGLRGYSRRPGSLPAWHGVTVQGLSLPSREGRCPASGGCEAHATQAYRAGTKVASVAPARAIPPPCSPPALARPPRRPPHSQTRGPSSTGSGPPHPSRGWTLCAQRAPGQSLGPADFAPSSQIRTKGWEAGLRF